ncbi:MAG: sulfotransferase [Verrucomicrobiota bacterium JB022]|nr:sulfotransferase [Verrucomicrobiota bacterium JB022]
MSAPSQPVLILGMHRSGTSFLASLLQKLGVSVGEVLLEGNEGNPHGHFEDLAFLEFQRRLVQKYRVGGPYLYDNDIFCDSELKFEPTAEERAEADAIVQRQSRPGIWGWKDPRTCLLLDFWLERLPNAKCIVVYRHPLEVYWSFLKRGDFDLLQRPSAVFHSYHSYYQPALQRQKAEPERFMMLEAQAGFAALPQLVAQLRSFLGLPAGEGEEDWSFFAREFFHNRTGRRQHALFARLMSHAHGAYEQLQQVAAFPAPRPEEAGDAEKEAQADKLTREVGNILMYEPLTARETFVPMIERFCLNLPFPEVAQARERILRAQAESRREEMETHRKVVQDYQRYVGEYEKYYALYQNYYWAWQETARVLQDVQQQKS